MVVNGPVLAGAAESAAAADALFSLVEVAPSETISTLSEALHITRSTLTGGELIDIFVTIVGDSAVELDLLADPVTRAVFDRADKLFKDPMHEIQRLNGQSSNLNAKVLLIPGDPTLARPAPPAAIRVAKTAAGRWFFFYRFIIIIIIFIIIFIIIII